MEDKELFEKLDRNWEIYHVLINTIKSIHSEPSPQTIEALNKLNKQMNDVSLILKELVNILKK